MTDKITRAERKLADVCQNCEGELGRDGNKNLCWECIRTMNWEDMVNGYGYKLTEYTLNED